MFKNKCFVYNKYLGMSSVTLSALSMHICKSGTKYLYFLPFIYELKRRIKVYISDIIPDKCCNPWYHEVFHACWSHENSTVKDRALTPRWPSPQRCGQRVTGWHGGRWRLPAGTAVWAQETLLLWNNWPPTEHGQGGTETPLVHETKKKKKEAKINKRNWSKAFISHI